MEVKCGRFIIDLNENDEIMYNGACYQITTRRNVSGYYSHTMKIANGTAIKMIKRGELVVTREETVMGQRLIFFGICK